MTPKFAATVLRRWWKLAFPLGFLLAGPLEPGQLVRFLTELDAEDLPWLCAEPGFREALFEQGLLLPPPERLDAIIAGK